MAGGRGKGIKAKLQESILRQRGLVSKGRHSGLTVDKLPPANGNKTLAMRLLEGRFGIPITVMLNEGSLKEVAEFLGVDESTVSKWRLRLKLRTRMYS